MKRKAQGCYNTLKNILLIWSLASSLRYQLLFVCCQNGFVLLLMDGIYIYWPWNIFLYNTVAKLLQLPPEYLYIKCPQNYFPAMEPCCPTLPKIDFSCNAPIMSLLQPRHSTSYHRAVWRVWLIITALHGPSVYLRVISDSSVGWYDLLMTSSDTNYCRVRVEHTAITLRKKAN